MESMVLVIESIPSKLKWETNVDEHWIRGRSWDVGNLAPLSNILQLVPIILFLRAADNIHIGETASILTRLSSIVWRLSPGNIGPVEVHPPPNEIQDEKKNQLQEKESLLFFPKSVVRASRLSACSTGPVPPKWESAAGVASASVVWVRASRLSACSTGPSATQMRKYHSGVSKIRSSSFSPLSLFDCMCSLSRKSRDTSDILQCGVPKCFHWI